VKNGQPKQFRARTALHLSGAITLLSWCLLAAPYVQAAAAREV